MATTDLTPRAPRRAGGGGERRDRVLPSGGEGSGRSALACIALLILSIQLACAQQMLPILERGPVGFLEGTTLLQQIGDLSAGDFAHPAVADWNGDGVADLVCGSGYGDLLLFSRTGDGPFGPAKALLPPDGTGLAARPQRLQVSPWLGELQPGGELNLVLGLGERVYRYTVRDGATVGGTLIAGPGTAAELPGPLAPCAAALEGEELDVLLMDGLGRMHRLTGAGAEPLMASGVQLQVAAPARAWAGRWDGDGLADLVIGSASGRVVLFRGLGGGTFDAPRELISEADAPGREAAPWATDWDGDGDLDLLVGWRGGAVSLFTRVGDAVTAAGFLQQTDAPIDAGRCALATTGDWNGDGLTDLVVGGEDGYVTLYARLPGRELRFERGLRIADSAGPIRAPGSGDRRYAAPALADWDTDGDLDLLVGGVDGRVLLWRNNGGLQPAGPLKVSRADLHVTGLAVPVACDYNDDGDMDLFVGARPLPERPAEPGVMLPEIPEGCVYFENTADRTGVLPVFSKGVPVAMILASPDGLRRDAGFLGPYAMHPARWRGGAGDFITVTVQGTFRFRNIARPGAYALLSAETIGRGLPRALLPPLYSATPALLDGADGLLAGDTAYGFVTWYAREDLE